MHIRLPSLLSVVTGGALDLDIRARTLAGALQVLASEHPQVALHLFGEDGTLRPHVLCFHNGTNTRWLDSLEVPVRSGDTLLFMQAVSGG